MSTAEDAPAESRIRIAQLIRAITAGLVELPVGVSVDAALRSLNYGLRAGHEFVSELAAAGDLVSAHLLRIPFLKAHDNLIYEPTRVGPGDEDAALEIAEDDV